MTKKGRYQPPKLALRLFRRYCRSDRLEELEGDLEEFFYLRKGEGNPLWKAQLFFWWNVLRCYKTYSKSKTQNSMTQLPLFKSYFKLALRHSWKNKWSVLINIIGLGLALSMCVFVYSIYAYNFEFDNFYEDTDNIYRVNSMTLENGAERRNDISPLAFQEVLENDIAGVQQTASFFNQRLTVKDGSDYFQQSVGVVSNNFFEMFSIPLWYGSLADFGNKPLVYLTTPTAKKLFGNEVALGEKLTVFVSNDQKVEVIVGGVFERIPLNSSFDTNLIMSLDDYARAREIQANDWDHITYTSHFVKANSEQVEAISDVLNSYVPRQNEGHPALKMSRFELLPFNSPLHSDREIYRNNANTRLDYSIHIIFTALASMVFLIACFNLANTSMAMIAKRLKEIGVRKTLGSGNKQILIQFLIEMSIVCVFAFAIALSMINITSSSIMGLFGETFLIKDIDLTGVILFVVGFLVFTTLVAGLVPALYAWKFQPVAIMRKEVKLKGVGWLNKGLTIAQYSFAIAVLASAITFSNNMQFLDKLEVGYENENVYVLNLGDTAHFQPMQQKIDQIPGIKSAGTFNHIQNDARSSWRGELKIDTSSYEIRCYSVGPKYLSVMGLPISRGRAFKNNSIGDEKNSIIVNQEFADQYFDGNDPINQVVKIGDDQKTIVGVFQNLVDDVYTNAEDVPTVLHYRVNDTFPYLIAKVERGSREEVEDQFQAVWDELILDRPYDGSWQKDLAFGSAVRDTENLKTIFMAMAILGGFLSIVGIFSLAKLNIAKRLKEISIRKVLGSTLKDLILTVNKSFFIVLIISLFTGTALGYLISEMTLSMVYKYYVDISIFTSVLAGSFIVILSALILTSSTLNPAKSNPVIGLRDE